MTSAGDPEDLRVATSPEHPDPDLRGRTYAIPFDRVWSAAMGLAGGGIPGWSIVRADDVPGTIQGEVTPRLLGWTGDVLVRVGLDRQAQTRVDLICSSRGARRDLGTSRRRVIRFLVELDQALHAASPVPGPVAGGGGVA